LIEAATAAGLDAAEARLILNEVHDEKDLSLRIDHVSSWFLGRRYSIGPLEATAGSPESLTASLGGFDCVTYIETVLAFALSATLDEFVDALREIRYEGGEVNWRCRNHYMIDWARNNEERGIIRNLTEGPYTVEKTRTLSILAGLPQKTVTIRCFPKQDLRHVDSLIQTGDVILFVSTRKNLDVFHTGFLIKSGGLIQLRHATRASGKVIEQPLAEFLIAHRMSGFILLRPICQD
jgi:hypothetical protein